ncbi:MAG: hypothetical protein GC138_05770 [Gammaproteobacteria bacterium]|nr:hypothetical protein [Gammaproteobacteria bacterium]
MVETEKKGAESGADRVGSKPARQGEWGAAPNDHFGYASEEERLAKRGMEDWELVDKIPESQRGVPKWFLAVVFVVVLVAVGLSFPFWGDRPGYERSWVNWGFLAALVYIAVAGTFVYFMVNLYGSKAAGRLDSDKEKQSEDEGENGEDGKTGDRRSDD